MERILGLGDIYVTAQEEDILITYALASCIGLVLYCTKKKVLGMAHIVMPNSNNSVYEFKKGYYADTAIDELMRIMQMKYGICPKDLQVKIYGGAQSKIQDHFQIGDKNIAAVVDGLKEYNLCPVISETRGFESRTIEAKVSTGEVKVTNRSMIL